MSNTKKKVQYIKVTITVEGTFALNDLAEIAEWRDSVIEYGSILEENVEVVEEK